MKKALTLLTLCACVLSHPVTSIAADAKKKSVDPKSIYARICGQPAINATVDLFYKKILNDKRLKHHFEDINMKKLHQRQKTFIAMALGGPNNYKGNADMRKVHAWMKITEQEFNIVAGHLRATLTELKVDKKLVGEVMAVVGSTKDAVLNRPAQAN